MFQEELRAIRLGLGMTQGQLAGVLGISASALGMYEQGRRIPGPRAAARMALALGALGVTLPPVPEAAHGPTPKLLGRGGGRKSGPL